MASFGNAKAAAVKHLEKRLVARGFKVAVRDPVRLLALEQARPGWHRAEVERAAQLPVVVAIRAQRIDRQPQGFHAADAGELHVGGVLAVAHPYPLFEARIGDRHVQIGKSPSRREDSSWQ